MNTPPTQAPSARSRRRRSSPWWSRPSVQAVSPRPSPVPSRPAGRMRPEGPTRGSGVSSPPGPTMPASPGCRRHRWTPPNTSRPWWGSRSFHGAADRVLLSSGYVRRSEHRLCESVRRAYPRVCRVGDSGLVLSGAEPVAFPGVEGVVGFPGGIGWGQIGVGVLWGAAGVTPGCVARRGDRWLLGRLRGHPG